MRDRSSKNPVIAVGALSAPGTGQGRLPGAAFYADVAGRPGIRTTRGWPSFT
ncbi:MAG: hypothetical protein ACYCXA_11625 [Actinomycetes bacterium]